MSKIGQMETISEGYYNETRETKNQCGMWGFGTTVIWGTFE